MNHEQDFINSSSKYRQVLINLPQASKFCSNYISTTKFTVFTFLPLFLYEQFHNYTNCFFLLISIIQQFPEASSLGRYTTVIPLCIILTVSAVKEILEDLRRHQADSCINKKTVEVYRNSDWSRFAWRDLQVGDLVRVRGDEFFPADMLFLAGSGHNGDDGVCYIETVNLDGENNYKIRHRVPRAREQQITGVKATVHCDKPNEYLYDFKGVFMEKGNPMKIPLNANNMLLRGSILRNTKWIVGSVIYTGYDTKIMKNSSFTRLKRSSVSIMVNMHIIILFVLFLALTLVHWLLFLAWNRVIYDDHISYLPLLKHQELFKDSTIVMCLIFGVIYSIVIPISLPVMQELSRFIQAIFITNDPDIYDEETDTATQVKTSSLNEDLALVKYIFSDKTGTLTKNVLEFKYCSIQGTIYSIEDLENLVRRNEVTDAVYNFFIAISVCPGVIPVNKKDDIVYYASSPDQKTLVKTAHDIGIVLVRRTHNFVKLKVRETVHTFEIKCDFEFTSDRKRTSVIVKDSRNELLLFAIGSDDAIISRANHDENVHRTQRDIEEFSSRGMRSICVAMAKIDQQEFTSWYPSYKRAYEALQAKEKLMAQAEHAILRNLTLLGATAVEDKLQDHVPETIEALLQAGINLWMLTGDKQETAMNIGYACNLLDVDMPLIVLSSDHLPALRQTVNYFKRALGERFGLPGNKHGMIVSGSSLKTLFESKQDVDNCISLMLSCRAVICCRTTPKQKAQIVENVQKRTHHVTLAVGDGANDVAMIQTASIGVGISGLEGLQAANAADYSIAQFKYLRKLLLVHGTWCYNRICKMIFFIYYKNVAIAFIQFLFVSTNAWSGFTFFDRWAKMLYNVLLTSLPTLTLGVFEKNLPESELMENPSVYLQNNWFNFPTFCGCLLNALFHAILLTWLSLIIFKDNVFWESGLNDHYAMIGSIVYTSLLVVVSLKSALHTCNWTNVTIFCLVTSLVIWPVVLLILSHTWPYVGVGEDLPRVFEAIVLSPLFWLNLIFVPIAVLVLDLASLITFRTYREAFTYGFRMLYRVELFSFSHRRRNS